MSFTRSGTITKIMDMNMYVIQVILQSEFYKAVSG